MPLGGSNRVTRKDCRQALSLPHTPTPEPKRKNREMSPAFPAIIHLSNFCAERALLLYSEPGAPHGKLECSLVGSLPSSLFLPV